MNALKAHGISRDEWVRRFKAAIIAQARLDTTGADDGIVTAELESWPEQDEHPVLGFDSDWMTELPEDAATDNLSNWTE